VIISFSIVLFATTKSYATKNIIAKLDNQNITKEMLENYVKELNLPKKYKKMLKNDNGLKELAKFYIERKLLLDYAKENDYEDSHFVKQHMMSKGQNQEMIMISAVLTKEVNDKVEVSPQEIDKYLYEKGGNDRKDAYFSIMSIKRQKRYKEFIEELLSSHDISYQ
jgi:hypothetical protein